MNKTIIESSIKDFKESLKSFKGKKESFAKLFCKDSFLVLKNDSCMVSVPCTIHEPFRESYKIDTSILYAWLDTFESNETLHLKIDDMLRFIVYRNDRQVSLSLNKNLTVLDNPEESLPPLYHLYQVSIDSNKLTESFKKALLCVSTSKKDFRDYLKHVAINLQASQITICATDGVRVHTRILPIASSYFHQNFHDYLLFDVEETKKLISFLNKIKTKNTLIPLNFMSNNTLVIHENNLVFTCTYLSPKEVVYNFTFLSSYIQKKLQSTLASSNINFKNTHDVQAFLTEIKLLSKISSYVTCKLQNNLLSLESTNPITNETSSILLDTPFVANNIDESKKYLLKFDASLLKKLTSNKTKQLSLFLCDDCRYNNSCVLIDSDTVLSPIRLTTEDFV